jgi:putative endonuclease
MWHVYVLRSQSLDRFYIGFSEDLDKRFVEHMRGATQTTSRAEDWVLVYYEACLDKRDAVARERQLKTGFGRGYINRRLENYMRG